MKIYVDILMLTNAVTAMVFVRCTAKMTREKLSIGRELAAGAVGGAVSLTALMESVNFFTAVLITLGKLAGMTLITAAAFRPRRLRGLIRRTVLYMICELGFGGICLALVGITGRRVLFIKNYVVYFDVTLPQLAVCCALVYLTAAAWDAVRRRRETAVEKCRIVFRLGSFVMEFPAFADTGNRLCDSFTGAPVVIFRSDELYSRYSLDRPEQLMFYGFRPIPYETINGEGLIYVTTRAEVTIRHTGGGQDRADCCAGIMPSGGKNGYAIYNPDMLCDGE